MQDLYKYEDERGILVPIDVTDLPFIPKRFFYVYNVPKDTWRGGHAHYETQQILICICGQILVKLESNDKDEEFILEEGQTCFIDKMIWDSQKFLTENSILLVLCSTKYDKSDYIYNKKIIKNE